ncbi:MAG: hypothetical protein SVR94_09420 [Pseudomonadota bacterium]|nr:hypothetical protein [Pseudomonadota bacterium]
MPYIEERVETLEEILAQTLRTVEQTSRKLQAYQEQSQQEMQAFRAEMQAHRETVHREIQADNERSQREIESFRETVHQEIQEYKERSHQEMQAFQTEMRAYREQSHQEMQAFQAEMRQFEARAEAEWKKMNRKWGELSRTLGRMAEDLVAPSVPRLLHTFIPCLEEQVVFSAVQVKKQFNGRQAEFDVVAVCGDYVLINETKNKLRPEDIKNFAEEVLPTARNFFPEYASKKFIGAIASLYVDAGQVQDGENRGLIVLGFGEEVMDVLNSAGFVPKIF